LVKTTAMAVKKGSFRAFWLCVLVLCGAQFARHQSQSEQFRWEEQAVQTNETEPSLHNAGPIQVQVLKNNNVNPPIRKILFVHLGKAGGDTIRVIYNQPFNAGTDQRP
jgi:hypothetical protein